MGVRLNLWKGVQEDFSPGAPYPSNFFFQICYAIRHPLYSLSFSLLKQAPFRFGIFVNINKPAWILDNLLSLVVNMEEI